MCLHVPDAWRIVYGTCLQVLCVSQYVWLCVCVTVAVNACVSMSQHVSHVKALDECLTMSQHRSTYVPRSVSCTEPGWRCLCVSTDLQASLHVAPPMSASLNLSVTLHLCHGCGLF